MKYDYRFREKIEVLDEVTKFLKGCAKQMRDNSQSVNENVDPYDKIKPTIQTDAIHNNLAHYIEDLDALDKNRIDLNKRFSNDFILKKGDIILEATKELSEIEQKYKDFFDNKEISSIWFLTTDMKKMNEQIEDILVSTKPTRKKPKAKLVYKK